MAIEADLKIFISWSGELAKQCTKVLRDWLPKMFDHIDPWASEVDIDAGTRSMDAIADRLNTSAFGIIVVTTENMGKPWLNFEAGALSKSLGADSTRVVPLMVNFDDPYQLQGPISQFHGTLLNKEGMLRVCRSIATVIGLDQLVVAHRFEWAWKDLEAGIAEAKQKAGDQPEPPDVDEKLLLKSLIATVNTMQTNLMTQAANATLASSRHVIESGLSSKRRISGYVDLPDPWNDGTAMQKIQDGIKQYAEANYRPVRFVSPMEWKGQKVVGVVFEDGQGMIGSKNEFNVFMKEAKARWPTVTVAIVSDRDLEDQGIA